MTNLLADIIHIPVLLNEVVDILDVSSNGSVLDLTFGLGGHADGMLARMGAATHYLGIDCDSIAVDKAHKKFKRDERVTVMQCRYEHILEDAAFNLWVNNHASNGFDAILMDLGTSSLQLKDPKRGFSIKYNGPLDMRMNNKSSDDTALNWLSKQTENSLAKVIFTYGEERASRSIAKAILHFLRNDKLHTTFDLVAAIRTVLPKTSRSINSRIDSATRVFQAIRIAVNSELVNLSQTIQNVVKLLKRDGRLGIISFHSLEDRIVKRTLRQLSGIYDGSCRIAPNVMPRYIDILYPRGLQPSIKEVEINHCARSARLRVAQRTDIKF